MLHTIGIHDLALELIQEIVLCVSGHPSRSVILTCSSNRADFSTGAMGWWLTVKVKSQDSPTDISVIQTRHRPSFVLGDLVQLH